MQYGVVVVLAASLAGAAGCVDDGTVGPEPRDECEQTTQPEVLDIELSGIDDTLAYQFVVYAEGGQVTLVRTPEQRSTFGEGLLPDGGVLVVSLDPDTLRVFVDDAGRDHGPAQVRVTAWTRAGLLVETTFMPAYEQAVPAPGDCFATITEHLAIPPHQ